ncbi:MAG: hypothetical protein ACJZ5B_05590 [Candidatus Poseidoniaceae archaeon]
MVSISLAGCITGDSGDNDVPVTAVFSYSPTTVILGQEIVLN